jgi:hypothetical protein
MFVADRLTYLQLTKTGSTFITDQLQATIGGRQNGMHQRLGPDDAPAYVIGSVRNPWSWYVSLWAYGCGRKGGAYMSATGRRMIRPKVPGLQNIFPLGALSLPTPAHWLDPRVKFWEWAYADSRDPERFRAWLKRLLDPESEERVVRPFRESGFARIGGLLSFRYMRLYCRDAKPFQTAGGVAPSFDMAAYVLSESVLDGVVRMEHIPADLEIVLRNAGYSIKPEWTALFRSGQSGNRNRSSHADTVSYYDDETRGLVGRKEKFLIDEYGYKFP